MKMERLDFTIKDRDILWFIPLSSKVSKYKPIIEKKIKKYGSCKSIMISEIANKKSVILIQNAFPTLFCANAIRQTLLIFSS